MLRFWVWSHYWPENSQLYSTSQLHATFANWHRAMKYAEEELALGFAVVDTHGQMKTQIKENDEKEKR